MAPPKRTDEELGLARTIGTRIRECRRKRGLTTAKLATLADVSVHHLYTIERGEHLAFDHTLSRLAKVLGTTLEKLKKA